MVSKKSGQALSLRPDLIRNKIWAEELGKLVDAVGAFDDFEAMQIMKQELEDLAPRMKVTRASWKESFKKNKAKAVTKLEKYVANDPILSLFDFYNGNRAIASASIGQVYKARIRRGPQLEAAIGKENAAKWGGKVVAIKIQRPDVAASAALDMYLLRKTAMWASKMRGGDLPKIADQFGLQLFGELDYVREANNCERFRALYGSWKNVLVPDVCNPLTRRRVLVQEWVEGVKGPWPGEAGLETVQIGIRCSVDQLMSTGLFHADPHRGNLLKTEDGQLAFLDYGMMADIDEEDRYGLFGLVIGLQNKDLPLITENLLKVREHCLRLSAMFIFCRLLFPCFTAWIPQGYCAAGYSGTPTAKGFEECDRWYRQGIRRQFCSFAGRTGRNQPGERVAIFHSSLFHHYLAQFDHSGRCRIVCGPQVPVGSRFLPVRVEPIALAR